MPPRAAKRAGPAQEVTGYRGGAGEPPGGWVRGRKRPLSRELDFRFFGLILGFFFL